MATQFKDGLIEPLIKKYGRKEIVELEKEIIQLKRRLNLLCQEFPKIKEEDLENLRKFVLLLKILTRLLENSLSFPQLTFSWEEIIETLLYLENDPNFMIKSMIREVKRKDSYKTYLAFKDDRFFKQLKLNLTKNPERKQKRIDEYV
ncbi:MAG: hypothetical protein ACTSQI_13845 [Candidatus Helarchaeota archaeon]